MIRRVACGRLVVLGSAALIVTGCAEDPAVEQTRLVILELVAQNFASATSRYRMFEEELLSPSAAPVWRQAMEHEDATVREWAVDALSRIGEPQDLERVQARLEDRSRGVRRQAVSALVRMNPAAAEAAFEALLGSEDAQRVVLGAEGAVELGTPSMVPQMIERLGAEALPPATRGVLAERLAQLNTPLAVPALLEVAADATADTLLRRLAAEALVATEGEEAAAALGQLIESDDDYIRELASTITAAGR